MNGSRRNEMQNILCQWIQSNLECIWNCIVPIDSFLKALWLDWLEIISLRTKANQFKSNIDQASITNKVFPLARVTHISTSSSSFLCFLESTCVESTLLIACTQYKAFCRRDNCCCCFFRVNWLLTIAIMYSYMRFRTCIVVCRPQVSAAEIRMQE